MSLSTVVGTAVIVALNTVATVVVVRFFRLTLDTDWAAAIYTIVFVPLVLLLVTTVLSGLLALGASLERDVALFLTVVVPLSLGISIDLFWMPAPEEVQVPDTA